MLRIRFILIQIWILIRLKIKKILIFFYDFWLVFDRAGSGNLKGNGSGTLVEQ